MARPVDQERHEDLALRAFEAVRQRGVAGITMAQIAADLGVKRSTLYWYFPGPGQLFDAVLEVILERQALFVAEKVAEAEHPIDQVAAWMHGVHGFYGADPELLAVLIQLWAVGSPGAPERAISMANDRFVLLRAAVIDVLDQGQAQGRVAPCDTAAVVDLCAVVIDGALVHRLSRGLATRAVLDGFIATVLTPLRLPHGGAAPGADADTRQPVEKWLEED